jgi:hypothetical protein
MDIKREEEKKRIIENWDKMCEKYYGGSLRDHWGRKVDHKWMNKKLMFVNESIHFLEEEYLLSQRKNGVIMNYLDD